MKAGYKSENESARKQNIRNSDSSSSKLKFEVKINRLLTAVLSAEGLDIRAVKKHGGLAVSFDTNGKAFVSYGEGGITLHGFSAISYGKDTLRFINIQLKAAKSGDVSWQAKANFFGGNFRAGLSGTFNFDPVGAASNGAVGRWQKEYFEKIP